MCSHHCHSDKCCEDGHLLWRYKEILFMSKPDRLPPMQALMPDVDVRIADSRSQCVSAVGD